MSNTLLEQWRNIAYDESADRGQLQRFWGTYFQIEKEIYEQPESFRHISLPFQKTQDQKSHSTKQPESGKSRIPFSKIYTKASIIAQT